MTFIEILKERIYAVERINDKFILFKQKHENGQSEWTSILYDESLKLLSNVPLLILSTILNNENELFAINKSEHKIVKIDINSWSVAESYSYSVNYHTAISFVDSTEIIFQSETSFIKYDFVNNQIVWEIESVNYAFCKLKRPTFLILANFENRSIITTINLKNGEKQWEYDFSNKYRFKDFFHSRNDFELFFSLNSTEIKDFKIFENKIIIQFDNEAILLAIEIETGKSLWISDYKRKDLKHGDVSHFDIDNDGLIYLLGDGYDNQLKTVNIQSGKLIWESSINWLKQSKLISWSRFSDFTITPKYIFITSTERAIIFVINKKTGELVDEMAVLKRADKRVYGVIGKPEVFDSKLLQLVVGELFVYDISEYV